MSQPLTPEQISTLVWKSTHHHVVAKAANCPDPSAVVRWITGEAVPSPEETKRLAFFNEWSTKIPNVPTFRLWLDGAIVKVSNYPRLLTPVEAIRAGAFKEVNDRARCIVPSMSETYEI